MMRSTPILWVWLPLACLLISCANPVTQLVVVVDTPLTIGADLDAIEIVVTGPSGLETRSTEVLTEPDAPALPLTLGVTPASDRLGPLQVVAIAQRDGREVLRTGARVSLTEGESRVLLLSLLRGCLGRTCPDDQTCGVGGCRAPDRPDLPLFEGEVPRYVPGRDCDDQVWDADDDGAGSVLCGGQDCDDDDPERHPDAPELCDGVDNNCDELIDPDCECAPDGASEACTTSCGTDGARFCESGVFGACQPPDEECNGLDDDCDGRIDEGHDYVARDPERISAEGRSAASARIIAVDAGWRIAYSVSGPDVVDGQYIVTRPTLDEDWTAPRRVGSLGLETDLAASDDGLMLTWTERVMVFGDVFQDRLFTRPLNRDGTIAGPRVQLREDVGAPARPRLVWDGTQFHISYVEDGLRVRPLTDTGSSAGSPVHVAPDMHGRADFVFANGRFAGAWTRGPRVFFASATTVLEPPAPVLVHTAESARHASLDGTGEHHLVAWYDGAGTTPDALRVTRVVAGVPSERVQTLSSLSDTSFGDVAAPTVRFGGGQYLVTWADPRDGGSDIYFARVSESGQVVQEATRLTREGDEPNDADESSAAYIDERFGVVWTDRRTSEIHFGEVVCAP